MISVMISSAEALPSSQDASGLRTLHPSGWSVRYALAVARTGENEMIEYICPDCREPMISPDSLAGRVEKCPGCGAAIVMPSHGRQGICHDSLLL